jgi:hypothetical protein
VGAAIVKAQPGGVNAAVLLPEAQTVRRREHRMDSLLEKCNSNKRARRLNQIRPMDATTIPLEPALGFHPSIEMGRAVRQDP